MALAAEQARKLRAGEPQLAALAREVAEMRGAIDSFGGRLAALDGKVSAVLEKCLHILDTVLAAAPQCSEAAASTTSVIFNSALSSKEAGGRQEGGSRAQGVTQSSQVIRLNTEASHPAGSWLGNPESPEGRVRVALPPGQLHQLDSACQGPEKLALALLEALFPRPVLAASNLTGRGKHKKRQLDPLLIYGVYCHLRYKYGIEERDWVRIRNNMDAKCRFFWRRQSKGIPLGGGPRRAEAARRDEAEEASEEPSYLLQPVWDGQGTLVVEGEGREEVYRLDTQDLVLGEELMLEGARVMVTQQGHGANILLSDVTGTDHHC